jgi:dCMP deaminase
LNTKGFLLEEQMDTSNNKRPSWDEYFIKIAQLTSTRSNCIRRKVGCVIVKETRILSLGYNGTPRGTKNCFEGGCDRCMTLHNKSMSSDSGSRLDLCMCLHAEENALLFVSQSDLSKATMYVTLIPCVSCTKKVIQCGIERVVYIESYNPDIEELSLKMMNENGILTEQMCLKN